MDQPIHSYCVMTYFVRMFVTADIHSAEHQFLPWLPGHQLRCLRLGMGFKEFHWHKPWKIWSYLRNNEVDNNPPNGWWDDLLLGFVTLMSPPLTICGTWLALPWEIPVRWTQPLCPHRGINCALHGSPQTEFHALEVCRIGKAEPKIAWKSSLNFWDFTTRSAKRTLH